jgi:hypothetical protein
VPAQGLSFNRSPTSVTTFGQQYIGAHYTCIGNLGHPDAVEGKVMEME